MLCPCPDDMLPGLLTPGAAAKQPCAGPTYASWLRSMSNQACLPATLYCVCLGGFRVRVVGSQLPAGELCVFPLGHRRATTSAGRVSCWCCRPPSAGPAPPNSVTSCCLFDNQPNDNTGGYIEFIPHLQGSQRMPLMELGRLLHRLGGKWAPPDTTQSS